MPSECIARVPPNKLGAPKLDFYQLHDKSTCGLWGGDLGALIFGERGQACGKRRCNVVLLLGSNTLRDSLA